MSACTKFLVALLSAMLAIGCSGTKTFHELARPGDTIAVAGGWNHHFQRDNITVTIMDAGGNVTTYAATPGNPHPEVRASINFYPDPASSLVVSPRIGQDLTLSAQTYALLIDANSTQGDKDWWETVVFVDLPDPMMPGVATVTITANDASGETASSTVLVVGDETGPDPVTGMVTGGQQNTFAGKIGAFSFDLNAMQLQSMERVASKTVTFTGTTLPAAIQVDMTHDGTGTPYVVNPVGSVKSVAWSDDGINLRVLLTPTRDGVINNFNDFKFYVSGTVSGLALASGNSVQAFGIDGAPLDPPDIEAHIE